MGAPPSLSGAVQVTTELLSTLVVPDTAVGEPGTVDGTAAADAVEAALVPFEFVAVTVNV
jgi:hypothetical protein